MKASDFDNLELIPKILHELQSLKTELDNLKSIHKISTPSLTTRKGVKEYLNISDGTLHNMINDGRFRQGIHFIKSLNKKRAKIVFIESAIINYRESK